MMAAGAARWPARARPGRQASRRAGEDRWAEKEHRAGRQGWSPATLLLFGVLALAAQGCDGPRFGTSEGFREQDFGAGFERSLPGWRATWEVPEAGAPRAHLRMSRQGVRVFDAALVRSGRVRVDGEGGHRLDARDGTRLCRITHAPSEHLLWCNDELWLAWRPEQAEMRAAGGRVAHVEQGEEGHRVAETAPAAEPGDGLRAEGVVGARAGVPGDGSRAAGVDGDAAGVPGDGLRAEGVVGAPAAEPGDGFRAEGVGGDKGVLLACPAGEEAAFLRGWRAGETSALALCVAWEWGADREPEERLLVAAAFAWMVAKGEAASAALAR